jgi:dihydropteroate synthase
MRSRFTWKLRNRTLELGSRTLVMGIVNVTPDSFSDGGHFAEPRAAAAHALRLLDEGADIIDIGGESTRPGQGARVSASEELKRVMPIIEAVLNQAPAALISIDTYKAEVAKRACAAGAEIVNDVSGLDWDPDMAIAMAELKCGAVLMHMRGKPEGWRTLPPLGSKEIVPMVMHGLKRSAETAERAGVLRDRIVLDPGFGFGKSFDENYPLLAGLERLQTLGYPLLSGTSRKSFIGRTLRNAKEGHDALIEERIFGSMATVTASILKGAHMVRVHDVKAAVDTAKIADTILRSES